MKPNRCSVNYLRATFVLAVAFAALAPCAGCAALGMSSGEVALLEAGTADACFMARTWHQRSDDERCEFVRENALRWRYFNALVHGRRPAGAGSADPVTTEPVGAAGGAVPHTDGPKATGGDR
jgi:hypothetical protein